MHNNENYCFVCRSLPNKLAAFEVFHVKVKPNETS